VPLTDLACRSSTSDDMGVGDLSVLGHPTISSPALDKIANEGVRFTAWYSGFHICSPSRAAMLVTPATPRFSLPRALSMQTFVVGSKGDVARLDGAALHSEWHLR
jgi:hypothetical protein